MQDGASARRVLCNTGDSRVESCSTRGISTGNLVQDSPSERSGRVSDGDRPADRIGDCPGDCELQRVAVGPSPESGVIAFRVPPTVRETGIIKGDRAGLRPLRQTEAADHQAEGSAILNPRFRFIRPGMAGDEFDRRGAGRPSRACTGVMVRPAASMRTSGPSVVSMLLLA